MLNGTHVTLNTLSAGRESRSFRQFNHSRNRVSETRQKREQAQFTFQNAIEVAHEAGALNKAGIAALTLIEELDDLAPDVLATAYEQASEWLTNCYNQGLLLRFKTVGTKLARQLRRKKDLDAKDDLFSKPVRLRNETLKFDAT